MGHTRFPPKETKFPLFMPQGHTAKPEKLAMAREQGKSLCNKKPGKCRACQFSC
jgi:hypothetical protein